MSARDWRAVREGETHAAPKTSTSNTQESFIVGVGASGALLAGAAIVFVTLVGLVSFNVWPTGVAAPVDGNVELSAPTANSSSSSAGAAAPVSAAAGQIASTSPTSGPASGGGNATGGNTGGGNDGNGGNGGNGGKVKPGITPPPTTTTPPPIDTGDTGSGSEPSVPGTASKSPVHTVHPTHPNQPHQSDPTGTRGKENGHGGSDSGETVTGKGPLVKPTPPDSSTSTTGPGSKAHGSQKSKH